MRTDTSPTSHFSNVLLTGTILLANIDMNGLLDYGLKAFFGGGIWLGYKLVADYIERKRNLRKNERNKNLSRDSGGGGDTGSDSLP